MSTAIVYTAFGGPEVLTLVDVETPQPTPGHVLVRVEAAGVNPIDAKLRGGRRASAAITHPRRVGNDGAGVVTAVGEDVDGFRPGDEVVFFGTSGTYASDVLVDAAKLHHRAPQVSAAVGAAIGIPAGTAYQSLRSLDVRAGDTLLVHGGSGSVGQAAIQFAVLWGAKVVATASPKRFDRVRELGATPVAYGEGLADRVREAAPDGVTVAFDAAGTDEALDVSLELVADRSRIATIVRGADAAGLGIRAFSGGSPEPLTAQQNAWRAEAVPVTLALLAADAFSVELGPQLPLAEAAEAHRLVESHAPGKITLIP
ncbi:NADP-dependent oxidoreductase [Microbacterium sp. SORGH_AS_0888]|uniref:quinone oxidoreductase family protein n=1 Tax=Microbacterium sp. SORGH_AS_0888 TaxID=3041791 RepID=UPI0027862BDB|nr:NADP-dependent oxidoreductase [Microbacterium sp. SORGH_AS_0888]MDQ1129170.1 NADPH2:quinone reductase [Microbacterium sp. SORGH_AS_0888]